MAVVTQKDSSGELRYVTLCIQNQIAFAPPVMDGNPNAPCPDGERHPIAEVTRESKWLFVLGWVAVIIGTGLQVWLTLLPDRPGKYG